MVIVLILPAGHFYGCPACFLLLSAKRLVLNLELKIMLLLIQNHIQLHLLAA